MHRTKLRHCQDHSQDFQKESRDGPNEKVSLTSGTENKEVIDTVILEDEDEESSGMIEDIGSSKCNVQERLTEYPPCSGARTSLSKSENDWMLPQGKQGLKVRRYKQYSKVAEVRHQVSTRTGGMLSIPSRRSCWDERIAWM